MSTHGTDGVVPDVSPDLPGLHWRAALALLQRLPQAALSRGFGRVADTPLPRPVRRSVIGAFARTLGIDASEAELPLEEYGSLNAFFVRKLRADARTWPRDDATIASPVDGVVGQHGSIRDGTLVQAKGRRYTAAALLGSVPDAAAFEGGSFLTIYLSPRHYHRIHAPCSGTIPVARHIPGALLPVNQPSVLHVPDLFPRNERVICIIDGPLGRAAVVAVGAYNVGRISTTFDEEWAGPHGSVANRRTLAPETRSYDPPLTVRQGDEIMAFHLGSTIVALVEAGARLEAPPPGSEVRLGDVMLRAAPRIV
ncbi:MAG TPA: archaetidylserine decarboxylase [Longimicrobiales bacterium]|nr:archaetidylserine decarboxylase [Longimicrobiales bacterium]